MVLPNASFLCKMPFVKQWLLDIHIFKSSKTKFNLGFKSRPYQFKSESLLAVSDSLRPHGAHGTLQARILEWIIFPFSRDLLNQGIKPRSPELQVYSLPTEPQGKPNNIGVGSLSLLQGIFLTQEWNQVLLHYRWILYQLSNQGSPSKT